MDDEVRVKELLQELTILAMVMDLGTHLHDAGISKREAAIVMRALLFIIEETPATMDGVKATAEAVGPTICQFIRQELAQLREHDRES